MKSLVTITALLILLTANGAAFGQSSDQDNPTPLTANVIKGSGVGQKVNYYYSFTAGPGELVVTLDLKASAWATNADIEIYDGSGEKIFYNYPNATTQSQRAIKKVTINGKQQLILKLGFDANLAEYTIKLTGAVDVAAPAPPADAGGSGAESSNSAPPAESQMQPSSDMPSADASAEASNAKPGKGGKFDLGVNLFQTVGNHFGLPTTGMLHIIMKDGSIQDIDLSQVKSASVKKS